MPSLQSILAKNEKKLDITEYCQDIMDEGETEVYITIKKMTKELKRKVEILSLEKIDRESSKKLLKSLEQSGLTLKDMEAIDSLDDEKQKLVLKVYADSDMDYEQNRKMTAFTDEIEKIVFETCIDKEKHSFYYTDEKGKHTTDIGNYDFWNRLGKSKLCLFIYNEIKKFSEDFFFKKTGVTKSDGQ